MIKELEFQKYTGGSGKPSRSSSTSTTSTPAWKTRTQRFTVARALCLVSPLQRWEFGPKASLSPSRLCARGLGFLRRGCLYVVQRDQGAYNASDKLHSLQQSYGPSVEPHHRTHLVHLNIQSAQSHIPSVFVHCLRELLFSSSSFFLLLGV